MVLLFLLVLLLVLLLLLLNLIEKTFQTMKVKDPHLQMMCLMRDVSSLIVRTRGRG